MLSVKALHDARLNSAQRSSKAVDVVNVRDGRISPNF
jgi:hypothetical protein